MGHKGQGLLHATVPPPLSRLFLSCPMGPTKVPQTARNRRRTGAVGVGRKGQGLLRATVPPPPSRLFLGRSRSDRGPTDSQKMPETGGEGGGLGWVIKRRASCAPQSTPSFPLIFGAFPVPGSHRQPENILTVAQHVPQTARQVLHAIVPFPPSAAGIKASQAHAKWAGKARKFWGG